MSSCLLISFDELKTTMSTDDAHIVYKPEQSEDQHHDGVSKEEKERLAKLYKAAKDENELLEFKNYELLFKIQELEQNQRKILEKLVNEDKNQHTTKSTFHHQVEPSKQEVPSPHYNRPIGLESFQSACLEGQEERHDSNYARYHRTYQVSACIPLLTAARQLQVLATNIT